MWANRLAEKEFESKMTSTGSDAKKAKSKKRVFFRHPVLGREILVPGENIIMESRPLIWPHLIEPVLMLIVGVVLTWLIAYLKPKYLQFEFLESAKWIDVAISWIGPTITIIGFLSLLIRWLRWRYTIYALTNKRILRRTGVFGRSYLDCSLGKVQNVEVKMPVISRIFKFGTVRIATARTKGEDIKWMDVKDPIAMQRQINEALEKYLRDDMRRD
jgi:uncharacterized membrane protein YdbT with pleckstrin-like domain